MPLADWVIYMKMPKAALVTPIQHTAANTLLLMAMLILMAITQSAQLFP
jgi:hypothetical protein